MRIYNQHCDDERDFKGPKMRNGPPIHDHLNGQKNDPTRDLGKLPF